MVFPRLNKTVCCEGMRLGAYRASCVPHLLCASWHLQVGCCSPKHVLWTGLVGLAARATVIGWGFAVC